MLSILNYVHATLNFNKDSITSVDDTIELLVSDIMVALGYDRRRNKNVIKLRNSGADWQVNIDENRYFLVKVVKLGDSTNNFNIDTIPEVNDNCFCILVTDGEYISFYNKNYGADPIETVYLFGDNTEDDKIISNIKAGEDFVGFINRRVKQSEEPSYIIDAIKSAEENIFSAEFINSLDVTDKSPDRVHKIFHEYINKYTGTTVTNNNDAVVAELKATISKLEADISRLEADKQDADDNRNDAEVDELKATISKLEADKSDLIAELTKSRDASTESMRDNDAQVERLYEQVSEKEIQLENKDKEIAELKAKVEELTTKMDELADSNNSSSNDEQLQSKIEDLRSKNDELSHRIEEMSSSNPAASDSIGYINQIERLNKQVAELEETLENKDKEIDKLNKQIENAENPKEKAALELLNTIQETGDPNEPVSFVGIVDGNLFQAGTIEKFIGLSLQELYNCVSFDLMQYVFDGDVFKIRDTNENPDFMLGTKGFNLDIEGLTENDCIIRLKTLFNKFPTVIFLYKRIGKVGVREPNEIITHESILNAQKEISFNEDRHSEEVEDNSGEFLGETFDSVPNDETGDIQIPDNIGTQLNSMDLAFAISDLSSVLFDESLDIKEPKFISDQNKFFRIRNNNLNESIRSIIYAIIEFSANPLNSCNSVANFDFSNEGADTNSDSGVNIPYTNYYIHAFELADAIQVFMRVCEICNVDSSNTFIYFANAISQDSPYAGNLYDTSTWNLVDTDDSQYDNDNCNTADCIIQGSYTSIVRYSSEQADIQRKFIKKILVVKTKQITKMIDSPESMADAITDIIATSEIPVDELIELLGFVPGTSYKIASPNVAEVNSEYMEIGINGNTIYISCMEQWQYIYSIINIVSIATGGHTVGFRVIVNRDLLNLYNSQYNCFDPEKCLAVQQLLAYTSNAKLK